MLLPESCFLRQLHLLERLSQSAGLFCASAPFAGVHRRRTAAPRWRKKLRLGLQPEFRVLADRLACRLPKLAGPLGDFVVADFNLVLGMFFLIRHCVDVHKFVVSVAANETLNFGATVCHGVFTPCADGRNGARLALPQAVAERTVRFYRPCGNVCGLCVVFIWRSPRSSRVSRDLEKMLSRFLDFGPGPASLPLVRT
jgi:hypothetical protein